MRIQMRSLRWLAENSTTLEDGGVAYNAPVNFFEHVARCTDWPYIISRLNDDGGYSKGVEFTPTIVAAAVIDHYVLGRNVVIESLDPEFCTPSDRWNSRLWVRVTNEGFSKCVPNLWGDYESALRQIRFDFTPISTLRTLAERVLTNDPEIIVEGKPHLIVDDKIAYQHVQGRYCYDRFIPRRSRFGRSVEDIYWRGRE